MRHLTLAALAATGLAALAPGAEAQTACAALADLRIPNVNLLSATEVRGREGLPDFCSVVGYVRPAINFEIRMPLEGWNGGFYMTGCGGFCGSVLIDAPGFINTPLPGLKRGYAVSTTDSGHWGAGSTDARWAYHNRLAEVDWGDRGIRETAKVSKTVIAAFYGSEAQRSIFQGCSTGGRQANMLAVRDPELFDGIINGAPALDYTGLVATFMAAMVQANTGPDGAQIITPEIVPLIQETVYGQCDGLDGLEDGLIADPSACTVDWSKAMCAPGASGPCLTNAQVATLATWYETGAVTSVGERLYPATIPYGSEPYWWLWLTGNGKGGGNLVPLFNRNFLQFMAFADDPGEGYTAADFDLDTDPQRLGLMASLYNSDDPDLSKFAAAGGKMLTWHGMSDAIVPHGKTEDYYAEVVDAAGGVEAAQAFNRLFLVPGMDHCGLLKGPGPDQSGLDLLTAMEAWLDGQAPETILATKSDADGNAVWTRPVCAWPLQAEPVSGDGTAPEHFECR